MLRMIRTALLVAVTLLAGVAPLTHPALAQGAPEPGSPRTMLQLLPLFPLGGDSHAMVTYANLALQAESLGIGPPEDATDEAAIADWVRALGSMAIHSRAAYMGSEDWRDFFGFDLFQIDQVVELSAPPTSVSLFRGRFDADALISHWEEAGYEAVDAVSGTYYQIADDFQVDLQSPGSRLAMASANYLAVLAPDMIAMAPSEQLMTMTLDLASGDGRSFADELNITSLLEGVPDDLASATFISGTELLAIIDPAMLLTETPDPDDPFAIATQVAEGMDAMDAASSMPPLTSVLLGMTAGGPVEELTTSALDPDEVPAARAVAVVATISNSAAWDAAEVIDARLQDDSGPLAWSEFFTGWSVHVVEEEPVVRVELELAPDRSPGILLQMLSRRELGFLAWSP